MNETTINTQPQGGDFNKCAWLEAFDSLKTVAKPDGECANDTMLKPTFPKHGTQSARQIAAMLCNEQLTHKMARATLGIPEKKVGFLAFVGTQIKALVACISNRHVVVDKMQSESVVKPNVSPIKFVAQNILGRRITSERQRKLLEFLVKNSLVTRRELDDCLGVRNSPNNVMHLAKKCGWDIRKLNYWERSGSDTRKRRYFYYTLSGTDFFIAKAMVKMGEGLSPPALGNMA